MEEKLQNYRSKKRREAVINSFKDKFFNMVSFNQIKSDTKSDHVVETTENKKPNIVQSDESDSNEEDTESLAGFTSTEDENDVAVAAKKKDSLTDAQKDSKKFQYFLYVIYFLFWITCYAIAIELQFGTVYLLFSGLFGIYFNTRTGPKKKKEISAYSVFNKNCEAIDGTIKPEQFEREMMGNYRASSTK